MTVLGHVAGVPFEEALLSLGPVAASLAVARAWLALRWRRRPGSGFSPRR